MEFRFRAKSGNKTFDEPSCTECGVYFVGGWLSFFHQIFGPGWPSGHFAQHGGLSQPRWWIHFFNVHHYLGK